MFIKPVCPAKLSSMRILNLKEKDILVGKLKKSAEERSWSRS